MHTREASLSQKVMNGGISDLPKFTIAGEEKIIKDKDEKFTASEEKLESLNIQLRFPLNQFKWCAQSFIAIFNRLERHGLLANAAAQQLVDALLNVNPPHISSLSLGLCYFGSEIPTIQALLYTEENILCLIKNADKAHLIASGMQKLASAGLLQNENANKNRERLTENASIAHSIGYVINYLNKASPNLATQANFELLLLHKDYIENIVFECSRGNLTQEIFNEILAQKVSKNEMLFRKQKNLMEDIKKMMSPCLDEANFNKIIEKMIRGNSLSLINLFHYSYSFLKVLILINEINTLNKHFYKYFDLLLSVEPTELCLVEHALTLYKIDTTSEVQDILYSLDNFEFFINHLDPVYPLDYCLKQLALSNLLLGKKGEINRKALTNNIKFAFATCYGLDNLRRCTPRMDSQNNFDLLIQYYQSNTKFLVYPTEMSQEEFELMVNIRLKSGLPKPNYSDDRNRLFTPRDDEEIDADEIMSSHYENRLIH